MEKHKIENWTEVNLDRLNSAEKIFKAILWAEVKNQANPKITAKCREKTLKKC